MERPSPATLHIPYVAKKRGGKERKSLYLSLLFWEEKRFSLRAKLVNSEIPFFLAIATQRGGNKLPYQKIGHTAEEEEEEVAIS